MCRRLERLHVEGYQLDGELLKAIPFLQHLHLDLTSPGWSCAPDAQYITHLRTLILDAPAYRRMIVRGCFGHSQTQETYDAKIECYKKLVTSVPKGEMIVRPMVSAEQVLDAWKSALVGGMGCWE